VVDTTSVKKLIRNVKEFMLIRLLEKVNKEGIWDLIN
jgi:hypothetical protein